ncbi:hypothetical protein GYMLUDRAFT_248881 [Collybiopsis luxurians FD-317 M1]|uniref:Transmembrane protein n=1 Tax=Collybiopsis luxurians FD-317 M1 TaxID=944289 RepID=A0A0D0BYX1_9AGAR|nr:hypothetical protein GYMLUDRAFT_248881 [Collybiopsis luxurians FD-317 M1]
MQAQGFSSVGMQLLSALITFFGMTILTHCVSRRLARERLSSLSDLVDTPWPRLCLLLVLLDSWLFIFSSGILVFGIGLQFNHAVCSAAILLCIAFYATSKLLVYLYLIERVHIVWAPPVEGRTRSRLKSPVDIICFVTVSLYAVVIGLLIAGRISLFRSGDETCVIGLKALASIPLLTYDLYINVFLTSMFLWPILKNGHPNQKVKRVARRAFVASLVGLSTSTVNIGVLFGLKGHELGWICLGSCAVDVTLNSYALYWATSVRNRRRSRISSIVDGQVSRDLNMFATKNSNIASTSSRVPFTVPPPTKASGRQGHHFHLPHFPHPHFPHIPHFPHRHHTPYTASRSHPESPGINPADNPFATPVFVPRYPQSEVRISANPGLAERPPVVSMFQSFTNLFRDEPEAKPPTTNIEVTVTTHLAVEHEDVDIGEYNELQTIHETV